MHPRKFPPGTRHLRTYAEFQSYLVDFAEGRYPFLWIHGRPGVAKTESIRTAMKGRRAYFRKGGQLTPAQFFVDCYNHRGLPVILDDAENLLDNKVGARLVSSLGDTTPVKTLCYGTTASALGDVPATFDTTSPLCVIANKPTQHEDIRSRAVNIFFDPTNLEIHLAVAGWYWCQPVHDFFGQHLYQLRPLDARWYVVAYYDMQAGRDWRRLVLTSYAPDWLSCIVQDLERDAAYPSRREKAERFVEIVRGAKGGSRASYHRVLRRLEAEGRLHIQTVPPIPLRRTRPPGTPSALELDAIAVALPDAEDDVSPVDVPAREAFEQPVRGQLQPASPPRMVLDDSLPGEGAAAEDDTEADDAAPE